MYPEVGSRNFFSSPQSQCRNLKEELPQSQYRNLKEALPQTQFRHFVKKCCSATATPQSQFFIKPAISRLQLETFTSAIFGILWSVE
jgi:hypothetical protein